MIVLPVTDAGARIDGFTIEYAADGTEYALDVPWVMVGCDRARELEECSGAKPPSPQS